MPTISQLPPAPVRTDDPAVFIAKTDIFLPALSTLVNETNTLTASLNSLAAGGAYAVPLTVDTGSIVGDSTGAGKIRFDAANQFSSVANLFISAAGSDLVDYSALLDTFDQSTSYVKGVIRIVKAGDTSKFVIFNALSRTGYAGYRGINVVPVASSLITPFPNGTPVILQFQRTGDIGVPGTIQRRLAAYTNVASVTLNAQTTDMIVVSGQAQSLQILAPIGTPVEGQTLLVRVKDAGTAQLLSYATAFRAGTDVPLPSSTTANKNLYMGFTYNAVDAKWDLVSSLTNI